MLKIDPRSGRSDSEKLQIFRGAAEASNKASLFELARAYEEGRYGLLADLNQAQQLYCQAANLGHVAAMYSAASLLLKPAEGTGALCNVDGVRWLRRAAAHGHLDATCNLAMCYQTGTGVMLDAAQAVSLYNHAANQLHPLSIFNLGCCFRNGTGVLQSVQKALECLNKAARLDCPQAQYDLGICHELGQLQLPQDRTKAIEWYRAAVAQGHLDATVRLASLLGDTAESLELLTEAAQTKDAAAVFDLAMYHERTESPDSLELLRLAASLGHAAAKTRLGIVAEREGDVARAVELYREAADSGDGAAAFNLARLLQRSGDVGFFIIISEHADGERRGPVPI